MKRRLIFFLLISFSCLLLATSSVLIKHYTLTVKNPKDILPLIRNQKAAYSIMYNVTPALNLRLLSKDERVTTFINLMLPNILLAKNSIEQNREFVQRKIKAYESGFITKKERAKIDALLSQYNISDKNFPELLSRMKTPPVDLILAQAALESGWGTSRFFSQGNNAFGLHSFSDATPTMQSSEDPSVSLIKFQTLEKCIEYYLVFLTTSDNFILFKNALNSSQCNDTPYLLSTLGSYSILGAQLYSELVESVINANDLSQYNDYQLVVPNLYSYYLTKVLHFFTFLWLIGEPI